jgi:hypothetical protein
MQVAHRLEHKLHALQKKEGVMPDERAFRARDRLQFRAQLFHFLGEIEAVFGIWLIPVALAIVIMKGWTALTGYAAASDPAEAVFVVVIMAIASSHPVLRFAEACLAKVAARAGSTPAAMTICALLLRQKLYDLHPSPPLRYATLALLFVNISVGGTLSHFAAPPIVMVASRWNWNLPYMLANYGWKAILGIVVADRKVENLSPLKAEELRDCADASVDIACGLGQKVYVVGLSAAGTLTAWIVQNWAEVTRAVLIGPALGFWRHEGTRLQKALALFLPMLPDIRTDWFSTDPGCPAYCYPGFPSKALGQLMRVSLAIYAGALERSPRVQDVILVTSQSDESVSDLITWQLVGLWRAPGLHELTSVDFPKAMKVGHDMSDPAQRDQQTQTVYLVPVHALEAP